jgi:hypothetical protein
VSERPRDYFERGRTWAAFGLLLAAVLLILGSLLDWVSVERLPETIPADQARFAEPFNGFDVRDGYFTAGAGIVLALLAVGIAVKGRYAWLGFIVSMIAGAVAIADYRDIDGMFNDFGGIGAGIDPGIGLTLVTAGALIGILSSATAIAATPRSG